MPVLKPSAEPQRPESSGPDGRPAADAAAPGCLSPKEVILRLVETVKAL